MVVDGFNCLGPILVVHCRTVVRVLVIVLVGAKVIETADVGERDGLSVESARRAFLMAKEVAGRLEIRFSPK